MTSRRSLISPGWPLTGPVLRSPFCRGARGQERPKAAATPGPAEPGPRRGGQLRGRARTPRPGQGGPVPVGETGAAGGGEGGAPGDLPGGRGRG